jgi:ribosomal protein S18 acetylase RimI-like enzyme
MAADALTIRPFAAVDEPAVAALWHAVFPETRPWNQPAAYIRRKRTVQPELFLVGLRGGELVATVVGGFDGVRGWIYHLAVAPPLRRRGIGRAMMAAVEAALRARGCPKINLQIVDANAAVAAFYERLGYAVEARVSMSKGLA